MKNIADLYNIFLAHPVVTTDTRDCPPDSLFFALKGASFDGNLFAAKALEAGCAYAVVDDAAVAATDERMILVDDVLSTLQQLAAHHRRELGTPIVQITGTNGKTTTKELTAAVLAQQYRVLYTLGNFNNHIGVPKTLLRLSAADDIAVVETGANHPGEIAALSQIVDADCGLITNVGKAHLEGFGSFEGVIKTKCELYDYLRGKSGDSEETSEEVEVAAPFIFLHADNAWLPSQAGGLETVTYGSVGKGYDVEGETLDCAPFLRLRWRVKGEAWNEVQTQLIGAYNIDNVLAAAAVGTHFGVSPEQVSRALEAYCPSNSRSEFRDTGRNRLVVDAYNANLSSMHAAIDNFRLIAGRSKMMILGDMRELGEASAAAHEEIAALALSAGCEVLWFVGDNFSSAVSSLLADAPARQVAVRHFNNVDEVKAAIAASPIDDKLILIKGSNGTKLFQLPELL